MGYLRRAGQAHRTASKRSRQPWTRLLLAALAACIVCPASMALAAPSLYDKPVRVQHVPLPADPQNPQAKPVLSCFYFRHFMIKEVDLGEPGAEQLSILPVEAGQPAPVCQRDNVADEKVVSADDWSGYFDGVKGGYVFFSAEDGWNDGLGFAVFTAADAKKVFEDVAKKWRSITLTPTGIAMRYERVYGAKCSLQADKAGCWQQIESDTGLHGTAPDCTAGYVAEEKRTPTMVQQVIDDPTILDYQAAASVGPGGSKITPVTGKAIRCRPSE